MSAITLVTLHNYLKLLETASELQTKLPAPSNARTLKEGLYETSRLIGADDAVFKQADTLAALIGAQRFLMIWGEPSATDHAARGFDHARALLTGLVSGLNAENGALAPKSAGLHAGDAPCDDLKRLLTGNVPLTCRLFRALFEHLLGFANLSTGPTAGASPAGALAGSQAHHRALLSTVLFILGAEIDREHLMAFMMDHGLFGMPLFEQLLQRRDYCAAFHSFRRLERAFMGSPAAEEAHLRNRLDAFNAQFGGKPYGAKILEGDGLDKAKVDAYLAAADLLEALALTPWCLSLNNALSATSSHCIRSVSMIARHFERSGRGEITEERANQEIADHLMAFARQFLADAKAA